MCLGCSDWSSCRTRDGTVRRQSFRQPSTVHRQSQPSATLYGSLRHHLSSKSTRQSQRTWAKCDDALCLEAYAIQDEHHSASRGFSSAAIEMPAQSKLARPDPKSSSRPSLGQILALPPQWLGMYEEFITKNAGQVSQIESALRSLTYIIPGKCLHFQSP